VFRKSTRPSPAAPPAGDALTTATIKETAPCHKSLRVHVGREGILPIRAEVLAEFQKQTTLPGFRTGKAPVPLVERQYAKAIHDETLQRATRRALEQVAKEHHLKPVGPFELQAANASETDGLTLEATVEVEPTFHLGTYQGIPLTRETSDVTPEDMAKAIAKLQESMAQLVPTAEGQPKQRQLPAIDDELAKDLGFETLDKLQEHVKAKLSEQKRATQTQRLEAVLCDALLARHAFEVPPRLVSHQSGRLTREFAARLLLAGQPEAQVKDEVEKFTEQLRTSAERQVKLSFIVDRIAEQEQVTVTQDELVGRLWKVAQRWKKDPAEVRKIFDAQELWPSVVSSIRQEKTMAWLMANAAITEAQGRAPTALGIPRLP